MRLRDLLGLSKTSEPPEINALLQSISKRAERLDPQQQAETFVSIGGIDKILLNSDNRIIFGRRGTGKTHVMSFVAGSARSRGDLAISVDLRTIGSNSYIYSDDTLSISERATRLLRDFLAAIHDRVLDEVTAPGTSHDIKRLSPTIDKLGEAIKEVTVRENIEVRTQHEASTEATAGGEVSGKASPLWGSLEGKGRGAFRRGSGSTTETIETGRVRLSVNIGAVYRTLSELSDRASGRIWLLVDEWGSLPEDIQPYLGDFIRRTFFPNRKYTVQIAAIEHRANFREGDGAESVGIELGSDASADVNLDDHLVFENSPLRSLSFFREMLYRHLLSVIPEGTAPVKNPDEFVRLAFTQEPAFVELVRACEGVPRDAINILQIAATRAQDEKLSIPHIRSAAKDWYDRDKASYVEGNSEAEALLHWIIEKVIGERKARAFLVRSDVRDGTLERLFDERILHIAKKSYSTKEEPGVRYQVWKIDYGCYVDLINTSRRPLGFVLEGDEKGYGAAVTIPEDDFRAIRRAVLNLDEFHDERGT